MDENKKKAMKFSHRSTMFGTARSISLDIDYPYQELRDTKRNKPKGINEPQWHILSNSRNSKRRNF